MKDKASAAMGLDKDKKALADEQAAHNSTKEHLAESEKQVAALSAALKDMNLRLQKAQSRVTDLERTLEAINSEKNAVAEAETKKRQEEARAAAEKNQMAAAEKKAALEHCQVVYDAFKGLMTDDEKLAEAICPYPWPHVQFMIQLYLANFGQDMVAKVRSHTSGLYRELLLGLLQAPEEFVVELMHDAMGLMTTDDNLLIELLCSASNAEIKVYKEIYQAKHSKDLAKRVPDAVSGDLKKIFTVLLQATREENTTVDAAQVEADATMLFGAGEAKMVGCDEAPFIQIIGNRSPAHLNALNEAYKAKSKKGRTLYDTLERQLGGKVRLALETMLMSTMNRPAFFAKLLREAWTGLGCNDAVVMRTIVARRYKDLSAVRECYNKTFVTTDKEKKLDERVGAELSGHLKSGLLKILMSVK